MIGLFVAIMSLVLGILVLLGGVQWLEAHRRGLSRPEGGATREELERMETALSALEARLDDLQEQQRFLERLLAERPRTEALPRPDGEPAGEDDADSILFDHDEEER